MTRAIGVEVHGSPHAPQVHVPTLDSIHWGYSPSCWLNFWVYRWYTVCQLAIRYLQASEWLLVDHHHAHAAVAWLDSPFYRQPGYATVILSYDGGGGDGNLRLFLGESGKPTLNLSCDVGMMVRSGRSAS